MEFISDADWVFLPPIQSIRCMNKRLEIWLPLWIHFHNCQRIEKKLLMRKSDCQFSLELYLITHYFHFIPLCERNTAYDSVISEEQYMAVLPKFSGHWQIVLIFLLSEMWICILRNHKFWLTDFFLTKPNLFIPMLTQLSLT